MLVGLLCHLSTEVGFAHKLPPHYISPLWPTNAILFGVLMVTPARHWWAYTLAAYFTSVMKDALAGFPMPAMLFLAGDIIEVFIAAVGARRFAAVFVPSTAFEALLPISSLSSSPHLALRSWEPWPGRTEYWFYWRVWFLSETVAFLTLAPAILTWIAGARTALRNATRARRCIEAGLVCGFHCEHARRRHHPDDQDEIGILLLPNPLERARSRPAEAAWRRPSIDRAMTPRRGR